MYTGEWSLIIISNNGDADPIAYQRDFSLSVGTQQTTTATPTIVVNATVTPVSTVTSTTTATITSTLVASTTTVQALVAGLFPTLTSLPLPSVHIVTVPAYTITQTVHQPKVMTTVVAGTPSCHAPMPNFKADPVATIIVTVIKSTAQVAKGFIGAKFRRAVEEREALDADLKAQFVSERHNRLVAAQKLHKRGPDASVVTVTETSTYITSTSTVYLPTSTVTIPSTSLVTRYDLSVPPCSAALRKLIRVFR